MNPIPAALIAPLQETLRSLGDSSSIQSAQPVSGGCINNALRLETANARYLLKWNQDSLPGMFSCEAAGLNLLAATKTVRVPAVLAVAEANGDQPAYILLEWLEGPPGADPARLGEQLAELHRCSQMPLPDKTGAIPPAAYGLDHDNYLGVVRQYNGWYSDWATFYAEKRLIPQMELAIKNGLLPPERRRRIERVIQRLPELLGKTDRVPSLIHGDLWGGNVIPSPDGLALIDPAVSFSDREAEIAYMDLFQGFSQRLYEAYFHAWPLDPGYSDRRDLLNLYHLINHLNHFGEMYGPQVDAVLRRYAG